MITAILFDIGSTILYEEDIMNALFVKERQFLEQHGYVISQEDLNNTIRSSILGRESSIIRGIASKYAVPKGALCEEIILKTRNCVDELASQYPRKLISGMDIVIEELSKKYILSLAGNASADIKDVLRKLEILQFFTCTDISDDIKIRKPDMAFFQYYLDKLKIAPQETILIGDRIDNDIMPANMLGIKTIWYKNGLYSILEPTKPIEDPDAIVENSMDILKAVERISG